MTTSSRLYAMVSELDDLPPTLVAEVEQFFINYNVMRNRVFKPLARCAAAQAMKMMKQGIAKERRKGG